MLSRIVIRRFPGQLLTRAYKMLAAPLSRSLLDQYHLKCIARTINTVTAATTTGSAAITHVAEPGPSTTIDSMERVVLEISAVEKNIKEIECEIRTLSANVFSPPNQLPTQYWIDKEVHLREEEERLRKEVVYLMEMKATIRNENMLLIRSTGCSNSNKIRRIRVPDDRPIVNRIEDCTLPIDTSDKGVNYVSIDDTIGQCMKIIGEQIDLNTGAAVRKSPLCLTRGGKTTILKLLFAKLKHEGFMPLYITFSDNFERFKLDGETQSQAILRLIAAQLINISDILNPETRVGVDRSVRIICDKSMVTKAIVDAISRTNRKFVLLIDELNTLAYPPDQDAAYLLRSLFLDPQYRYLVFSTHRPVFFGDSSASGRSIKFVNMPHTMDLSVMQNVSKSCNAVTQAEIALNGGIPSVVYCIRSNLDDMGTRFDIMSRKWPSWANLEMCSQLLTDFLIAISSGKVNDHLADFERFSTVDTDGTKFPLFYISKILQFLNLTTSITGVDTVVNLINNKLQYYVREEGSGKDWETIVTIAVMLQALTSQLLRVPLTLLGVSTKDIVTSVHMDDMPPQIALIGDANKYIAGAMKHFSHGAIVAFSPTNSNFEFLDLLVVFKPRSGRRLMVWGL